MVKMNMSSNSFLTATTLVVLLAVATAMDFQTAAFSISKTVWINKDTTAKCEKQIKKQLDLFSCQRYLLKSSKMSSMSDNNNNQQTGVSWREEFPECCDQLEKISEKCRCSAVEEMLQQLKDETEKSGWEGVDTEEMLLTAKSLPSLCRLKPQYCYIETGPFQARI